MTSTLASMRRLSVRAGASTFDVAVPVGTRVRDLLESGGFPAGSHVVDASGAPLPDDLPVGDLVEDGASVYVVDSVHTPTLTRVGPGAPGATPRASTPRAVTGRPAPARAAESAAGAAPPAAEARTSTSVPVDAAAAGARTRSTGRRGRGRPDATRSDPRTTRPGNLPGGRHGTDGSGGPGEARPARRAVVPPPVGRHGAPAGTPGSGGPGPSGLAVPPPPGPARAPLPPPPGPPAGTRRAPGAHAAGADTDRVTSSGATVARRGAGLPAPPLVAPPPGPATGPRSVPPADARARADRDRRPRRGPAEVPLSAGSVVVPIVLGTATALVVALAAGTGTGLPPWSGWTAGGLLLVAAVVAAGRPPAGPRQRWGRIAAAVCGGSGGVALATAAGLALDVAAVCGLVVASVVAMLGRSFAVRDKVFDPWITVTAVTAGAVAVDAALAIVLSWPAYVAPLLLAGAAPLLMRALPAAALDVPDEQLIDTERLSNTSWSARTGVRRRRRALRQATVEAITLRASGLVAAGTVVVGLFATAGYGIAVLSTTPGSLTRWALLAEGVLLAGGIGLAGRTVRARFDKRVLRLTATVVTLETGYHLVRSTGPGLDVVVVLGLVVVALGVIGTSLALDAGWRSLRLSRLADFAEGFCVVFSLPAALLAVDVITVLRQAAS